MNESDLIALLRPLAAPEAESFSNDAAALALPENMQLIVTTDTLVEGVHFIGNEPAERIAKKALRTNLSDLAAMGAEPYRYSLALSLTEKQNAIWCEAFVSGLKEDQKTFGISLLGGDTTRTPAALTITITAMGLAPKGAALTRSGAKEGDGIYVTGTLGEAAMGLKVAQTLAVIPAKAGASGEDLQRESPKKNTDRDYHVEANASPRNDEYYLNRYQLPEPRVEAVPLLRKTASAAMDISDGLAIDLHRLCAASKVGALVEMELIPSSRGLATPPSGDRESLNTDGAEDRDPAVNRNEVEISEANPRDDIALYGGDDYELLFTAAPEHHETIMQATQHLPFPITKIGKITAQKDSIMLQRNGAAIPLKSDGYQHDW